MIVVEARMRVRPGVEGDYAAAVRELIAATRTEPDHVSYTCARDLLDDTQFVFVEHWADLDAFGRHLATEHYVSFKAVTGDWVAERDVRFHEVTSTTQR